MRHHVFLTSMEIITPANILSYLEAACYFNPVNWIFPCSHSKGELKTNLHRSI